MFVYWTLLTKEDGTILVLADENPELVGDADGYSKTLLHTIVDHKSSGEAVKMADKYIPT
jgi:hypothetical protein